MSHFTGSQLRKMIRDAGYTMESMAEHLEIHPTSLGRQTRQKRIKARDAFAVIYVIEFNAKMRAALDASIEAKERPHELQPH